MGFQTNVIIAHLSGVNSD